jgi:exopolysaccharide biosynthesis predicted pyruvyltransferase EpsI
MNASIDSLMARDEFENIIQLYKDYVFDVIELGGNHGDTLIYLGIKKVLIDNGIQYRVFRYNEINDSITRIASVAKASVNRITKSFGVSNDGSDLISRRMRDLRDYYIVNRSNLSLSENNVILVQGGGDMNDIYSYSAICLLKTILNHLPYATLIIAPQSYYFKNIDFSSIFRRAQGKVHLFCRERYSYAFLHTLRFKSNVRIHLSKDGAFYLLERIVSNPTLSDYDLVAFREDNESIIGGNIRNMLKEALRTKVLQADISEKAKDLQDFISIIARARTVFTDRLHVGIVAALMKKIVFLFPTGYWKTKGVYEYSLKSFRNVVFVDKNCFSTACLRALIESRLSQVF